MDSSSLIKKFQPSLPLVRKWIYELLDIYKNKGTPLANLGFQSLQQAFPLALLEKARVIDISGKLPFPPLSSMGLPELSQIENMHMLGVTYKDLIFINHSNPNDMLYFHELVHVVQWERLGVDNFLLAYGVGLMQFGYRQSPLEQMVYSLQRRFKTEMLPMDVVGFIRQKTDSIWDTIAPLLVNE